MLLHKFNDVHLRQGSAGQDGWLLHERLVKVDLVHLEGKMFGHLRQTDRRMEGWGFHFISDGMNGFHFSEMLEEGTGSVVHLNGKIVKSVF